MCVIESVSVGDNGRILLPMRDNKTKKEKNQKSVDANNSIDLTPSLAHLVRSLLQKMFVLRTSICVSLMA